MNSDQFSGKWKQLQGSVKEKWGKLTDDDLTLIDGQHDKLVGKVQEKYGLAKEQAHAEVTRWVAEHEESHTSKL